MSDNLPARIAALVEADLRAGTDLVATFRWRDRNGRWFWPKDMETRHVFHTIRMIWNNQMPKHMAFRDARFYHFGPSYTPDYLRDALITLWAEFETRKNIPDSYLRDIEFMRRWLAGPVRDGRKRIDEAQRQLPAPDHD
jgi:hypothetical protein